MPEQEKVTKWTRLTVDCPKGGGQIQWKRNALIVALGMVILLEDRCPLTGRGSCMRCDFEPKKRFLS